MDLTNKSRDFLGLPAAERAVIKENYNSSDNISKQYSGIHGSNLREGIPHFIDTDSEVIYENSNNAFIVLGRDRPGGIATGYGGKGHTQAGAIDLVVGRMSPTPKEIYVKPGEKIETVIEINPMFVPIIDNDAFAPVPFMTDAARIYISQKTDIDTNFNLKSGPVGCVPDSIAKSGIAIKADAVRIIGNEGIKIVTRPDGYNS